MECVLRNTWRWSIWRRLEGGVHSAWTPFIALLRCNCGNVRRCVPLFAPMKSRPVAVKPSVRHGSIRRSVLGSTRNQENDGETDKRGEMLNSVYAALSDNS